MQEESQVFTLRRPCDWSREIPRLARWPQLVLAFGPQIWVKEQTTTLQRGPSLAEMGAAYADYPPAIRQGVDPVADYLDVTERITPTV